MGGIIVLPGSPWLRPYVADGLDAGTGIWRAQPHIGDLHHSAEVGQRIARCDVIWRGRERVWRDRRYAAVGTGLITSKAWRGPRAAGLAGDVQRDLVLVLKVLGQGCVLRYPRPRALNGIMMVGDGRPSGQAAAGDSDSDRPDGGRAGGGTAKQAGCGGGAAR